MNQKTDRNLIEEFLNLESAGGIILVVSAVLAIILINSPVGHVYEWIFDQKLVVGISNLIIDKPLLLWINDGLMAVFFFLVGLEIKREVLNGELSSPRKIVLPVFAAIGGMAIPSLIYVFINWGDAVALKGWAIPAATDIAFALGILTLLGRRVPVALKVFLLSVAIIDDLGAILIIAAFYTSEISAEALIVAGLSVCVLLILNRASVQRLSPYILVGVILWVSVLKSGVHATLAGVLLAFFIPAKLDGQGESPLKRLEHDLHGLVAFFILPVFAFANSGVKLESVSMEALLSPVPLGVVLGLFIGKQTGVLMFAWLAVKSGLARLPDGVTWSHIYGAALLTGIGFTMSLFIGSLAFEQGGPNLIDERLGILLGSFLSAICGYFWLRLTCPEVSKTEYDGPETQTASSYR